MLSQGREEPSLPVGGALFFGSECEAGACLVRMGDCIQYTTQTLSTAFARLPA